MASPPQPGRLGGASASESAAPRLPPLAPPEVAPPLEPEADEVQPEMAEEAAVPRHGRLAPLRKDAGAAEDAIADGWIEESVHGLRCRFHHRGY